ncbi:methionyl-tRNA formyltransferase [bacterium]|nr:methionyl-tRNA formyltransferase [bacterium]
MRTVFMGTPRFAAIVLAHLVENGRAPALVVSQPDRPRGRGRHLEPTPVRAVADESHLPLFQPEKLDAEANARIAAEKPELIFVAAYGKILRPRLLDLPPLGCVNAHASLLPKYRGAAPINWAIIRGESVTGVTIMKMDTGVDTGPTFLRREVPIAPDDNAATLTDKTAHVAGELALLALDAIEGGSAEFAPQDDAHATYAPMLEKDDGLIDWTHTAGDIDRLIRGVTPWPGARTTIRGHDATIIAARPERGVTGEPHVVLEAGKNGLLVACGDGALRVTEIKLAGRKAMAVAALLNGFPIEVGERIGA